MSNIPQQPGAGSAPVFSPLLIEGWWGQAYVSHHLKVKIGGGIEGVEATQDPSAWPSAAQFLMDWYRLYGEEEK